MSGYSARQEITTVQGDFLVEQRGFGGSISIAVGKPRHASVACNEILSIRWLQPDPREAGKVPNLKIPGLEMKQLKVIFLL